tara:strand:- start:1480 stop:2535 length:1056 start_codon:yes stop_codon:yes gene_type:complete
MRKLNVSSTTIVIWAAVCLLAPSMSFWFYQIIKSPNVLIGDNAKDTYVYIKPDWKFSPTLLNYLVDNKIIDDGLSFAFVAKLKDYQEHIKPGKYLMKKGWTNSEVIDYLKQGNQSPVKLTFNNILEPSLLGDVICKGTLANSTDFNLLLKDSTFLAEYGFTPSTILTMFLPDTYQVYWTNDAKDLFKRMNNEYKSFWNDERLDKAKKLNLTPIEVSILASIVYGESKNSLEQPKIARVYLNRLDQGIKLQADPTWAYIARNDTISSDKDKKRLHLYRNTDSPYNLYMYKGLTPGPINMPMKSAINGILDAPIHDYIFIVSKGDGTGEHYFAKTLKQHNNNLQKYKRALRNN